MRQWKSKVLTFDRGLDTTDAVNVGPPHFEYLQNVQFGRRGELRTRPGLSRVTGFSRRGFDATGNPTDTTVATLAATGYARPAMNASRRGTERPLLLTRGRAFTWESTDAGPSNVERWSDRGGVLQARWDYVGALRRGAGTTVNPFSSDVDLGLATTFDFGPGPFGGMIGLTTRFSEDGEPETTTSLTTDFRRGNGAAMNRGGAFQSAVVYVQTATNNLRIAGHAFGSSSFSEATIATDALTPGGMIGAPVICADYDTQTWFVAYWTNVARVFKVLRVNSSFVVTATYTSAAVLAGNERGIWVTNSSVAGDKVVVAVTTSTGAGVLTRVLNHALVDQAIDVTGTFGLVGAHTYEVVTLGVAESGEVWGTTVAFENASTAGPLVIFKRSTAAATLNTYNTWPGVKWGQGVGGFSNWNGGVPHFLVHQPVKVGGRVLIGTGAGSHSTGPGPGVGAGYPSTAARWYVQDVTDLADAFTTTGTLGMPLMVARSELDVVPFGGPRAAIVDPNDSAHYRFPVVTWDEVVPVVIGSNVSRFGSAGFYSAGGNLYTHRLADVVVAAHQVAEHREATVVAGAVPRVLSSGNLQPVGFPWQGRPSLNVVAGGAGTGSLAAGAYSVIAVWRYTDEAGLVHRSEPSEVFNVAGVVGTGSLACTATSPLLAERDVGALVVEFYVTEVNPSATAPHYLAGRSLLTASPFSIPGTTSVTVISVNPASEPLYTDGNVMAIRHPAADGGVATVGERTWISDGRAIFASRLGPEGGAREAPSWNDDGPLRVEIPTAAGRVVALSAIDDKLLVHCTGGVWALTGEGPDDTGAGLQFRAPVRISDVGTSNPRTVVSTSRGVFFVAANTGADGTNETGGIWLIDRSLTAAHVSRPLDGVTQNLENLSEGTYVPERELLLYVDGLDPRVFVLDLRENKWVIWNKTGESPVTIAAVAGLIWGVGEEPLRYDRTSGADVLGSGPEPIQGQLVTGQVPLSTDHFRRGRLRAVTPMVRSTSDATFDANVTLDGSVGVNATGVVFVVGGGEPGPEFLMTNRQKGRVAEVSISFTGADQVQLAGLRFLYKDEPGFPSGARSKME